MQRIETPAESSTAVHSSYSKDYDDFYVMLRSTNLTILSPNRQKRNWTWTYFKSDHNDQEEPVSVK
ncbi:2605_t:CDS:2 [Entrophospora sp. SA101]|nr:2605_t:CDS:2 [Entrophospora sp. SA101]